MIKVVIYLLMTTFLVEDSVCATFQDFLRHFPEKIVDAFKSSWRIITQGSPELRRTAAVNAASEGPLWIKIPKRNSGNTVEKVLIEGAKPTRTQYIDFREKNSLQDVTEWFSTLVSSKSNERIHKPVEMRRPNKASKTKLRIPFFSPPQSNYNYLMRTVVWRTPRDTETGTAADYAKRMAVIVNLSPAALSQATMAPATLTLKATEATWATKATTHTYNPPEPHVRITFRNYRIQIFNSFVLH